MSMGAIIWAVKKEISSIKFDDGIYVNTSTKNTCMLDSAHVLIGPPSTWYSRCLVLAIWEWIGYYP